MSRPPTIAEMLDTVADVMDLLDKKYGYQGNEVNSDMRALAKWFRDHPTVARIAYRQTFGSR